MNVLFITSSRIGDAVLSTGLLAHILQKHPDARLTVVCGPLPAALFEGLPQRETLIVLEKKQWNAHWLGLWTKVAGRRWDMVVDLRNSAVSRLIRARRRYVYSGAIDRTRHKVEQNAAVMGLAQVPAPTLWFTEAQKQKAAALIPAAGGKVLGIGPTANWAAKTWPAENFIALVNILTAADGILPGARVAVFAAPGEEKEARRVLSAVPKERQLDVIGRADPGTAAAALARCAFYVGNDSGLMHCAAAVGVPTLGLFGPSWPHLYRPWGTRTAYAATPQNYDELIDFEGYDPAKTGTLMSSLTVEKAVESARKLGL